MNTQWRHNITIIILVCMGFEFSEENNNPLQFSDEFVDFLQSIGSRLHKYKQKYDKPITITESCIFPMEKDLVAKKSNSNINSTSYQGGKNDVLLMKLISFYENKYNLNRFTKTNAPKVETNAPTMVTNAPQPIFRYIQQKPFYKRRSISEEIIVI